MATVDLDNATQAELEVLPGVGPAKAKKILQLKDVGELDMEHLVIATGIPQRQ